MFKILCLLIALIGLLLPGCHPEEATPTPEKYFPTVKTIIQTNCLSCHSSAGTWEGRPIAFDSDEEIAASYASIKATVADPVTPGPGGNQRMPKDGMLSAEDIAVIVKWFEKGGKITD